MGIKELSTVIASHAKDSIRRTDFKSWAGRKVSIDSSVSLYQCLTAFRKDGSQSVNAIGEATSHLNGMFYRTIRMLENGIKPVYVFDGTPPDMKLGELKKRIERRIKAQIEFDGALEKGDIEAVNKLRKRMVKVTTEQNEQCKHLLRAMGVSVVDAPCEAEAQCAELVRSKQVYGCATADMDALTFGSDLLVRHLTFSETNQALVKEYSLEKILKGFEMNMDQFIDLCILLGCDYCGSIRGIGKKRAFDLMTKYKSIECILDNLDTKKYIVPEKWNYVGARELFKNPDVIEGRKIQLEWSDLNEEEIVRIMVKENDFNEIHIRNAIDRLNKSRQNS